MNITIKKTVKKGIAIAEYRLFYAVSAIYGILMEAALPVCASSGTTSAEQVAKDAMKPVSFFVNVLIYAAQGIGGLVIVKGVIDLIPAVSGHDSTSAIKAGLTMLGGGILLFLRSILTACGISV